MLYELSRLDELLSVFLGLQGGRLHRLQVSVRCRRIHGSFCDSHELLLVLEGQIGSEDHSDSAENSSGIFYERINIQNPVRGERKRENFINFD